MWKTGAAMSAVFASTVTGKSKTGFGEGHWDGELDRLSNQVGMLEDANAIRNLHLAFESNLDRGLYEEVIGLFADDAEVVFNGGRFMGKEGIRRLYCDHFAAGRSGRKIGRPPGFETDPAQPLDIVEIAGDRKTATARFPYSLQIGAPMMDDSSFVSMARLQGEGIIHWWESGTHEIAYSKENGGWKIRSLEYRTVSTADYKPGRSYAIPIAVASFTKTFPKDPTGPDKLA